MNPPGPDTLTILFAGHDFRFIRPFMARCEQDPRFRVLVDEHAGHEIASPERCRELLPCADIIFCEWCLGNAVWYSQHKLPRQRILVRLHSQEMRLPYLDRVCWDNVDALILICPLNQQQIRERYPFLRPKTPLIYNPVNCAALNLPKLPGAEFNLGILGICPLIKAPHLALEILAKLKQQDRRYTLYVKGRHAREYEWLWRRPNERAYYEKFYSDVETSPYANSVVLETYGEDVPLWFTKVGFILSTSDREGSHQSVAEGMAAGSIPIIRNWPGADLLYPPRYVARNVDDAVAAIRRWRTGGQYLAETDFCRAYAQQHFDQATISQQLEALCLDRRLPAEANPAVDSRRVPPPDGRPALVILCYLPPGFRGGYRIRIEQEVRALVRHGCDVELACLHPVDADPAALTAHAAELETLHCPVHLIPVSGFFDLILPDESVRDTLERLERLVSASGLLIVHAEALYSARIGLLLRARARDCRLVFDCHGTSPEEERLSGAHPSRVQAMEVWERRVLAAADLNVFVSQAMNDCYLKRYGFAELPHVIVPCCVADERFGAAKSRCPVVLPGGRPILAYAGTFAVWQCGEEMIRLFAQLARHDPELFFLLLAPAADHGRVRELMQEHRLPESAVRLAALAHDEVASALRRAHAGVLLRRAHPVNEVSSPTKFGEYLAAGLPVIMTEDIGDFARLAAREGVGLVLSPGLLDLEAWPDAELARIAGYVRESQRAGRRRARRCRDVARKHLHWDAALPGLVQGYRNLLDADRGSAAPARVAVQQTTGHP
jgi:glycosyltransferase involved in cell wall biosynthesis